jgi:hypothetical protein
MDKSFPLLLVLLRQLLTKLLSSLIEGEEGIIMPFSHNCSKINDKTIYLLEKKNIEKRVPQLSA